MWEIFLYLFIVAALAAAVVAGAILVRGYLSGDSPLRGLFASKAGRRIVVIEQASVDARRRLVLIRRDNVEHLIMTGGPTDVVIESGIGQRPGASGDALEAPAVFARAPRAVGER